VATFSVTNINDSGTGSFRQAILDANAATGADTITFEGAVFTDSTPDVITLTSTSSYPLTIADDTAIVGTNSLTISGNNPPSSFSFFNRTNIFAINSGKTVNISGLTIERPTGENLGSISNSGTLTLSKVNLKISSNGTNITAGDFISNSGTLTVVDSSIDGTRTFSSRGIDNSGTLTLINSSIQNLSSQTVAGGIYNTGTATIISSTISNNSAGRAFQVGGGIYNAGNLTVVSSAINSNGSSIEGSGLHNVGTATLINSTVSDNRSFRSSFGVTGGIYNSGTLSLSNSTTSGNLSSGDIVNIDGGTVTLQNSLVSRISRGSIYSDDVLGNFIDNGFNLIGDLGKATGFTKSTLLGTNEDPLLNPTDLAVNAGSNSLIPADITDLDGDGNTTEPIPFDVRGVGFDRINNGIVDIGAFESSSLNTPPVAIDDIATVLAASSVNISVLANDSDPDGDYVTLSSTTAPSNGIAVIYNNGTLNNLADDFITYTPDSEFCGTDSFSYTISDSKGATSTATVNVTVKGSGTFYGTSGDDTIDVSACDSTLVGNGGRDRFLLSRADGTNTITDFGGVSKRKQPSTSELANVDTLQFDGSGLTARNLLLTQVGADLEVSFEGVNDIKVILQNFALEKLDNLPQATDASVVANILFEGDTQPTDGFDVFSATSTRGRVEHRDTGTFLNDLNNNVSGYDNSNDVINGQGGDDRLKGFSGDDLLRGGQGNDTLIGGAGNDFLVGNQGSDQFVYNTAATFDTAQVGIDTLSDFASGVDKIVLDKTTFRILRSNEGSGFSNVYEFTVVKSDVEAESSGAVIVYNSSNGKLFYNENTYRSGFGAGAQFASLAGGGALNTTDFVIRA
jgi:hypothetical protein